jgi:hypothetical protein
VDAPRKIKTEWAEGMTCSNKHPEPAPDREVIETHDLFLRALAVPIKKQKNTKKKQTANNGAGDKNNENYQLDEPKWPEVLAFDTESRTTVDQSLTFGVWQRCKLVGQN